MNIDQLQTAILSKDPDGVVAALADWTEQQRAEAAVPFNLLMTALGFDDRTIKPCSLQANDTVVQEKRKELGIQRMSWKEKNFDYEMNYIACLAQYGMEDLRKIRRFSHAPNHEMRSAQIMADRQPPWFREWYRALLDSESPSLSALMWSYLYQQGLLVADDFPGLASQFSAELPGVFSADGELGKQVLREIPACRDLVYHVLEENYHLFHGKDWVPVIEWLCQADLFDQVRFLQAAVDTLHEPHNQTERNGCVLMAKAVTADGSTLAELQPRWIGLLSDSQASVVGFALDRLAEIEKAGQLSTHEAVAALPAIFVHKPKTHAKKAVEMLGRIAADSALRAEACQSVTTALMHPHKDVQKAALTVLEIHLQPDDEAIETIRLHTDVIAATLKSKVDALLSFQSVRDQTSGKVGEQRSKLAARLRTPTPSSQKLSAPPVAVTEFQQRADDLPDGVCRRLRIPEALTAAKDAQLDDLRRWSPRDMHVLKTTEAIVPISSVDELVDVTAAAVEKCDCPDTPDRILSGITRLYLEHPKSFESMTKSLAKRGCGHISARPWRGIVGGFLGTPFSLIISAWLGIKADEEDYDFLRGPIQDYLIEVEQRIRAGTAYPLLSASTHCGGWIDPRIWVDRLLKVQNEAVEVLESDLLRSCLRLTPDGRVQAIEQSQMLQPPFRALALAALGGEVQIDDSWSPPVWIAALRARDAWIDLSGELSAGEQKLISEDIAALPDVVYPSCYRWQVIPRKDSSANSARRGLIDASPLQAAEESSAPPEDLLGMLMGAANDGDVLAQLSQLAQAEQLAQAAGGFFTAQLHHLTCYPAPAFAYPYLATQWPLKLDWYWNLATIGLSRRVESKSSVDEPYGQFLLPLLQQDRPLTLMAARALWIATVSKDDTARSMAIETWITLAGDDRCDAACLAAALVDVSGAGWVKLNRVGEALSEVAAVSPLHAWVVASVLQEYLLACSPFPKDVAKLLDPLEECCERLGRSVAPELSERLQGITAGKAKPLARSLRDRIDQPTAERRDAITAALEARLARGERFASS